MARMLNYLIERRRALSHQLPVLVGAVAVLVLLLATSLEASPSTNRPSKFGKSVNRSYRSTSQGSPSPDSNADNATASGGDRMCSIAGSDRPGCRKVGMDMKKISLELIRQDILKKLRIDENKLPNVSAQNFVFPPSYLSGFVDMQGDSPPRDDNYDDEHATTEKIIAFSKPEKVMIGGKQAKNLHHFSFSEKMSNTHIESATMYVHVRYTHHNQPSPADKKHSNLNIRIREVLPMPMDLTMKGESPVSVDYGMFKPLSREDGAVGGMAPHGRHSKWVQIDIRDALSKWVVSNSAPTSRKITLAIDAVDNSGKPSQEVTVVSSSESDVRNTQYPFIEVHVSDTGRSRHPRDIAMTCDENSAETRCCKYPLTVDFEEFGWDWIIAPKKYDAFYCSGECPLAFLQKYPHNHIVQQAMPSGVGGPCCAAKKMSSISMLYFDRESNIVLSVLPGMVVEKCGCT